MAKSDALTLFEGILIGIYGNWLVSFIDKITFTKSLDFFGISLWLYQPLCILFSFACLILLVGLGIFRRKELTPYNVMIIAIGHFIGLWASLYVEGFTFHNLFFLSIGGILFFLIYASEITEVKQIKRRKTKKSRYYSVYE